MSDEADQDALDEVIDLLGRLALGTMEGPEMAVFALVSAALRVQEQSGEVEDWFDDFRALLHRHSHDID